MKKINKLIAEFMDYENVNEMFPFDGELHYHTSWDWLMPVVNKCLNIYHIEFMNDDVKFDFYDCMGNKERTYNVVVEFIKNQNN